MTHDPSTSSEFQRHVAAASAGRGDLEKRSEDFNSGQNEDDSSDRLARGMSDAGDEAGRYSEMYRSDRGRRSAMARGREQLSEAYEAGRHAYEWAEDYGYDATRYAKRGFEVSRRRLGDYIQQNPLMVGAVGVGIGLIVGALMPIARRERRVLRPLGDDLRRTAKAYGADAMRAVRREAERTRQGLEPVGDQRPRQERGAPDDERTTGGASSRRADRQPL